MRHHLLAAGLLAAAIPAALPAAAQTYPTSDGWAFAVSPYVWLPGLSTSVGTSRGTVDVDMSSGDAVGPEFRLHGRGRGAQG